MPRKGGKGPSTRGEASLEIDLPAVLAQLDDDDPAAVRAGIDTIRAHVSECPEAVVPTVPKLRALLESERIGCHVDTAYCLAELATESPDDVAPSVGSIVSYVSERPSRAATAHLLRSLAYVADERPDAVVDHVEEIVAVLERPDSSGATDEGGCDGSEAVDDGRTGDSGAGVGNDGSGEGEPVSADAARWGIALIASLSREYPTEIEPAASVLTDAVSNHPEAWGTPALPALGRLVRATPSASLAFLEHTKPLIRHDDSTLRNNAIGCLGDVAHHHPAVVEELCPQVARALDSDDPKTRANAAVTIARVAAGTESIDPPANDRLRYRLEDDHPSVRANVCVALGYGRVVESRTQLEELAANDPDADVRERASWALSKIS